MTALATTPETATWQLDPTHSSVEFAVKHLMIATVKGTFTGLDATLTTDEAHPESPSLRVTVDVNTISTHQEQRDNHLRSADFFDVARSEEHTSELQSRFGISYAVFCLKKK